MIQIKKVNTDNDLKEFIAFPYNLYKNCKQYVPDMKQDMHNLVNPHKNPALSFCKYQLFLAYKENAVVGRVMAIINPRANETWHSKYVRFGYIDFIDDIKVSEKLLDTVAKWGRKHGMTMIQGPMGFTDYDKEGMLIDDFDLTGSMATIYNYPYYKEHMETLGYTKEADWISIKVKIPQSLPPRFERIAKIIKDKYNLTVTTIPKSQMYGKSGHEVFHLLNKAYTPLFGFTPFDEAQINALLKQYVPLLNYKMMPLVYNDKKELIGVAITLPSLSRALQKSKGQLWPFGWFHLLKALKWHYEDTVELMLIGVRPDYHGLGVNSLFFEHLLKVCTGLGFKYAETCPQLETNLKELSQWKDLNPQYVKPRRCWKKEI